MKKGLFWCSLMLLLILGSSVNMNTVKITVAQALTHDIAVTRVTPFATSVIAGELVNITVVVENQGTAAETFTVTLYYDSVSIKSEAVTNLAAYLTTTLVFTWDTTDRKEEIYAEKFKEKTYAIKAAASTVPGETDTEDNTIDSPMGIRVLCQYIAVIPQRTVNLTITSGMDYTVAIYTDYNGTDIWSWQFILSYNPALLEGIEVRNGDLITTEKHSNAKFKPGEFNNTIGELGATGAYFEYIEGYDTTEGPGTLAYVTFRAKGIGESNITFVETYTYLLGPFAARILDDVTPKLHHLLYGYFRNAEIVIHDVSVISVTPSLTSVTVGEPVNVTVVVENQGTPQVETFDVKAYYNYDYRFPTDNLIGTETVENLAPGARRILNFEWDTKNTKPGNCTVTAVIPKVDGEKDTEIADNTLQSDKVVTVKARGTTPLPITEIVIGIVVLVAVVVVIGLVLRRRKKPISEEA